MRYVIFATQVYFKKNAITLKLRILCYEILIFITVQTMSIHKLDRPINIKMVL